MNDVIVPICEAADAAWAASQAIAHYRRQPVRIHLVNVQRPLPKHVAQFFNRDDLREFHVESGMRLLDPAMRMLDDAGVPHEYHVLIGHQAETIVQFAEDRHCSEVIVDATPAKFLSMLGLGSVGSQVRHLMQAHAAAPAGSASSPSRAA